MKITKHCLLSVSVNTTIIVLALGIIAGCSSNRSVSQSAPARTEPDVNAPGQAVQIRPAVAQEAAAPEPVRFVTIYFDYDKSSIRKDQQQALNNNAQLLSRNSGVRIIIEGHCDERGTDEYNLALGQRRADAVKTYLTDYGIDVSRLSVVSYGETRPVDRSQNEQAWTLNRRSEFTIVSQ